MVDKKITMSDIAKIAGVGKSTVSRYFNDGYVKEETRAKIKKVIDDYNYQPNALAKILKAKQSKMLGIITASLDSPTSSRMMMALDEYVRNEGYIPIIINTNHNESRELQSIESLWKLKVDGIILLATEITRAHRDLEKKIDIPMIFVGQEYDEGISIIYDDYHAGYDVGEYVVKKGHQNIVYLGIEPWDKAVGVTRKNGVLDALKDHNIKNVTILETDYSFDHARNMIRDYLDNKIPSVIICATDNHAMACYKEILERGLSMPDDISLVGFGGYEISSFITPSLTTIRFENEEAGCIAGRTLIDLIEEKEVSKKRQIDYVLMEGGSVKQVA